MTPPAQTEPSASRADDATSPWRRKRPGCLAVTAVIYLTLLGVSHLVRRLEPEPTPPSGPALELHAVDGERVLDRRIRVSYIDRGPATGEPKAAPNLVLLHGSPGSKEDFSNLVPMLSRRYRVIAPDLPGFGSSEHDVPDYSIRAHAHYVLELLDALGIDEAQFVGFSMGGGVALNIYDLDPQRVESLTLLSSIGVQELELFGEYRVNHAIHGAQLGALWLLREGVPHMGWLDDVFIGIPYARNFYDSDQRPLRGILERFEPPMLIIHGRNDFLVPPSAAIEHHRLVPQSELEMLPASHFMVFLDGAATAERIEAFADRVERGQAARREDASPDRVAEAALPFDPSTTPPHTGVALLIMMGTIVLATFITEDLACIAAGLLVAHGQMKFVPALVACFIGILVGDLLLFLAGRFLGRPALRYPPLRWFVNEERVEIASRWLERRGPIVIGVSRFLPGARLPAYFTAGMLHTNIAWFALYFFVAVALWTPLLVTVSAFLGERALGYFELFQRHALANVAVLAVVFLVVAHLVIPAFTFHGRRKLYGRWRRLWNWEFWPPWVFYPPVAFYACWLGLKHHGPLVFTAANPAIEAGGFIAESKHRILAGLAAAGDLVARTGIIPANEDPRLRMANAAAFMGEASLDFPIVLKPDAGQRGSGVAIVRSAEQLESYLRSAEFDTLIQEYVPGDELGIFYYRWPAEERGRIFSITEKRMPFVVGDGRHTIEHLILSDRRAVCAAEHYLTAQAHQLFRVPELGEKVQLVELGTHCRGAIFLDGLRFRTDALESRIDAISRGFRGFFFGRYDVRTSDFDALRAGRDFKIIELNGVTSEATHIYDPAIGLFGAYRILFEQWRIAFAIGAANRDRGTPTTSLSELLRLIRHYRRIAASHPG